MKAAVLYRLNQPLKIMDLVQDPPKAGEIRVKMRAAGICASDRHMISGYGRFPLPAVLGHEAAGTVAEVGAGVTQVKPGDRCMLSWVSSCGHCRTCRIGLPSLCETNFATGAAQFDGTVRLHDGDIDVYQMNKLGAFAEYVVAPQQAYYPIPDEVPFEVAALIGCCVTTGVGAVINNPAARPGMSIAVFGCGGVGLSVIQGARIMNASRIIAVDIHDHKLQFSRKFGATDVLNSRRLDPVEAIKEMTGDGVDMAIDSFGSPATTASAVKALRSGGTAVLVGVTAPGTTTPIDMPEMMRGQKTLVGCFYGFASPHETFKKVVDFYLKDKLDIDSLITRTYSLEQVNEGLDAIDRGEDGRGVIEFGP